MDLYGLALVPCLSDIAAIIDFQHRARRLIGGPVLSTETNLPHVSILQCPFRKEDLTQPFLPHVTLGRTVRGETEPGPELQRLWGECLAGRRLAFDHLVLYKAGEWGALSDVLCSTDAGTVSAALRVSTL